MGLDLAKNDKALAELAEKGMAPDPAASRPAKTAKN
jgi:hypothetical protein